MYLAHCFAIVAFSIEPAAEADAARFFRAEVAAVLEAHCLRCHGASAPKGGLSLTTAKRLLDGSDTGPVVDPGKPETSLLYQAITGDKPRMPRGAPALASADVARIRRWIADGALWPEGVTLRFRAPATTDWWSLQPLNRPAVPTIGNPAWSRNPIDAFVLSKLEAKRLTPSPEADRRTLIRRLTFDLHGLPPTPDEIDAFLADSDPRAYEKVVDRLLASPRYGERWGRHWLDVVHYGDTHGYDKDKRRNNAWPYRDYVIRSLNADKPYGQFLREQIAGDALIPGQPDGMIATGFIAAGPWDFVGHVELREGTVEKAKTRLLDRDDMVTNAISATMSLTIHCARCHDHKFDPIPQRDYYRLQAVFAGVERGDRAYTDDKKQLVYTVLPRPPREIRVLSRGDVEKPGEVALPGGLSCVAGPSPDFTIADPSNEGRRRVALADWIVDPRNPLTWRSIVNRVWHYHFGRGIVATPNDFGRNGSLPTHPELLDWLAVEFRDRGQSLKELHRLIVTSATYRQNSLERPEPALIDADNRLLWRMHRQRLDAEETRDTVLSVSGKLDVTMGGPGFDLFRFKDDHSPVYDHTALEKLLDPATYRRTVYRFVVRSVPNPFLDCLDCADPNVNTPVRNTTLTALQALALLNDPFMVRQAECFAERLGRISDEPAAQLDAAYRLAFGRLPTGDERAALLKYAAQHGLANLCRLLFNTNEFVFVD